MPQVSPVPGEQLIAAVAAEGHGDMLTRVPADQGRRQQRAVGEGLAEMTQYRLDGVQDVPERQAERVMPRAEVTGDHFGILCLIVSRMIGIADAEGLHRRRARAGQTGGDDGRIEPAGEERAERDIGNALGNDSLFNSSPEFADCVRVSRRRAGRAIQLKELFRLLRPVRVERQSISR